MAAPKWTSMLPKSPTWRSSESGPPWFFWKTKWRTSENAQKWFQTWNKDANKVKLYFCSCITIPWGIKLRNQMNLFIFIQSFLPNKVHQEKKKFDCGRQNVTILTVWTLILHMKVMYCTNLQARNHPHQFKTKWDSNHWPLQHNFYFWNCIKENLHRLD